MPEPSPSQEAFVHAVMAVLGKTQTELGADLGESNGYNAVHAKLVEKTALKYREVIRMLYMADFLTPEAHKALQAAQSAVAAEKATAARDRAEAVQRRLRRHQAILRLTKSSR
jgi:hypothetical protein